MSWRKGTKIIINIITKIFRNFNIKKNFYISCIFSSSISNTYTYLKIIIFSMPLHRIPGSP